MWTFLKQNYPEIRNVKGLHGKRAVYRRWSAANVLNAILRRTFPKSQFFAHYYVTILGLSKRKYHVFNGILNSRCDWVSTFETTLPRLPEELSCWQLKHALHLLSKDNCRALVAISRRAANSQNEALCDWQKRGLIDHAICQKISRKLIILPPPQNTISRPNKRQKQETLRIIFVGNLFFLKGGREAFRACSRIVEKSDVGLELIVVSSMQSDTWFTKTDRSHEEEWQALLDQQTWVTHKSDMPNEDVLKTIKGCHLALFPTKRDSYGYFTLEAQACGVPVISSDYGAQPEINNDECGWIVATSNVHEHEDEILTSNLVTKIEEAFNENLRFEKGLKSLLRIAQSHDYSNFNLHDLIHKG